MADVFISYKREERAAVERLAQELRALQLSVWFDASLSAGETFSDEIDREARAAKVILVCWSPAARGSDWVKAEALIGFTNKTLAACYAAGPDGFDPPAPFNATHAEDLRAWLAAPSAAHAGWKSLLRRIGRLCGREDIESYGALDVQAPAAALRAWLSEHDASPLFMTVDALLRARDAEDAERARLEEEARALRAQEEAERARQEAERQAVAAEARRQATVREAERRAQEQARVAEQKQRVTAAVRRWLVRGGVAWSALVVLLAWSQWNRNEELRTPLPTEAFVDARTTPSNTRAPVVRNPARLPDYALFRECDGCPEMVVIPGGTFQMGSPAGESGRQEDEDSHAGAGGAPVSVRVPRFAIARFETNWDEWAACVSAGVCQQREDSGYGRGRRPVINVDWQTDTRAFINFVNARPGAAAPSPRADGGGGAAVPGYRLPSEAEWEYAARAGTTTAYFWGADANAGCVFMNGADATARRSNSDWTTVTCEDSVLNTALVGSYRPSPYGLFDMTGNVWEWVEDCYRDNLSGQTAAAYTTSGCFWRVLVASIQVV